MRVQKYKVLLAEAEVGMLQEIINNGKPIEERVKRAKVLMELYRLNYHPIPNKLRPQEIIANRCDVSLSTVRQVSKNYASEGLEVALNRKPRETPPIQPIVTGDIEARIIALACSAPPKGYSRWSLRLLEDKVVELGIVDSISDTTIFRVLKKRNLSLT